jgi:hypothetical protein
MVNTKDIKDFFNSKDLRDMFDDIRTEAGKRAGEAVNDVQIGRRSGPPGLLLFGIGLTLGAAIGLIAAIFMSPYSGEQARAKISERVDKMREQHDQAETNGAPVATPTGTYERQGS